MPKHDFHDAKIYDGLYLQDFVICQHESRIYRKLTQANRSQILESNRELRKSPGALRDLKAGRFTLSIPYLDYENLKRKYPVLAHGDPEQVKRFYDWFEKSPESLPYRVQG